MGGSGLCGAPAADRHDRDTWWWSTLREQGLGSGHREAGRLARSSVLDATGVTQQRQVLTARLRCSIVLAFASFKCTR